MKDKDSVIKDAKQQALKVSPQQLLPYIDLTRLQDNDKHENIIAFLEYADQWPVAAICLYAKYISLAKIHAPNKIIATVINFPFGQDNLEKVYHEMNDAIKKGANELDIVFPYTHYMNQGEEKALAFISACKKQCPYSIKMKVILETGLFKARTTIDDLSLALVDIGVDFIKTSTGKTPKGASLDAAFSILHAIKGSQTGLKVSGGIKTIKEAAEYYALSQLILDKPLTPNHFRIGTSSLVEKIAAL